jgi:hypothetical protein
MEPADQVLSFDSARVAASIMSSGAISKSGSRVGVGRLNAPAAGRARRLCAMADGGRSPPPPKPRRRLRKRRTAPHHSWAGRQPNALIPWGITALGCSPATTLGPIPPPLTLPDQPVRVSRDARKVMSETGFN